MVASTFQEERTYVHVQGDIPIDLPSGSLISIERNKPPKIYGLGFQPAKSIPEIPRWFLQKYMHAPATIVDPFAGSGTTVIEALLHKSYPYWLDYHPLSRLICKVKTTPFACQDIRNTVQDILQTASHTIHAPTNVHFTNKDFWFQLSVQEGLEILKVLIDEAPASIRPVLWIAFAATVRKTSDMNDGMILAARRSHIAEIPKRSRQDVYRFFEYYIEKTVEALEDWQSLVGENITLARELPIYDARHLHGTWLCDAFMTSPPYVNAMDYVWASKFELHWLGLVKDDKDRLDLYAHEIGTERLERKDIKQIGQSGHTYLDELIAHIYFGTAYKATTGQNALRARVVYQYFLDMQQHFQQSFLHLRPGGYYCFAIGETSKICGVDIPVAALLTDVATSVGFTVQHHFHVVLKNRRLNIPRNVHWAGNIKHDTVIVLEKKSS